MVDISIIKSNYRYKDFTYLDKPSRFCDLFDGSNINLVQIHSAVPYKTPYGMQVIGFSGAFSYIDGEIKPLDSDSYYKTMIVYGYQWFSNGKTRCLDIIVGDEW